MSSRAHERRGVLLLICLVVLVFFLLTGLTFVLVATQWREGAESHAAAGRSQIVSLNWQDDAQQIAMGMIRGDDNALSPFRFNNLLDDLYGNDSIVGTLNTNVDAVDDKRAGGQFWIFRVTPGSGFVFDDIQGFYNGQVLSVIGGDTAVESFRIVNYVKSGSNGIFLVSPTDSDGAIEMNATINRHQRILPLAGDAVLINGRPFNGLGLGYEFDSTNTEFFQKITVARGALMPNLVNSSFSTSPTYAGGDEDYDAPDFNNPWLAMVTSTGIKPSWHDPALNNFIGQNLVDGSGDPMVHPRQHVFTPNLEDHPNFAPADILPFDGNSDDIPDFPTVDNDGDGVLDSFWINPGLPVRRTADGRYFRPMVAMLVVDLDGKVNVNTAGTPYSRPTPSGADTPATDGSNLAGDPNLASATALPVGTGFGPSDINMSTILGGATDKVLHGEGTKDDDQIDRIPGRYGWSGFPGTSYENVFAEPPANVFQETDLSVLLHASQYGGARAFGPLDIAGTSSVGLDDYGRPRTISLYGTDDSTELLIAGDPYEMRLSAMTAAGADNPFLPAELEALYRHRDTDSNHLPQRLADWTVSSGTGSAGAGGGSKITSESWSIPVAGHSALSQILRAKMEQAAPGSGTQLNDRLTGSTTATSGRYLPLEILAGHKMDINRPFGNGRNETSGLVAGVDTVDDAREVSGEQAYGGGLVGALQDADTTVFSTSVGFDHNNDGVANDAGSNTTLFDGDQLARYEFARHLYIMLRMFSGTDAHLKMPIKTDPEYTAMSSPTKAAVQEYLYNRRLAQYAINVVDFRDADAAMTPFEYDKNPFDGWSVDGDPGTIEPHPDGDVDGDPSTIDPHPDRDVVWGCEAPALILSETLGFHNVRTDDLDSDDGVGKKTDDPTDPDPDFDSFGIPEASLFVELYCPANHYQGSPASDGVWSDSEYDGTDWFNFPDDLYDSRHGVDVDAKTNAGYGVWRMLISEMHTSNDDAVNLRFLETPDTSTLQPSNMDLIDKNAAKVTIERMVLFNDSSTIANDHDDVTVFRNENESFVSVRPGEYLIVGPRAVTTFGQQKVTPTSTGLQEIRLDAGSPSSDPPSGNIFFNDLDGNNALPTTDTRRPAVMIATDPDIADTSEAYQQNRGLNISAPEDGYPAGFDPATGKYSQAIDKPLDSESGSPVEELNGGVLTTSTYNNVRTIFLQRLANPMEDWNALSNPYITVDAMPIPLCVFNGDADSAGLLDGGGPIGPGDMTFGSFQRGKSDYNIWEPGFYERGRYPTSTQGTFAEENRPFFTLLLRHTLGYFNELYNDSNTQITKRLTGGGGAPEQPFPWLVWNDKAFTTPHELLQVPASPPQRLLHEFSFGRSSDYNDYLNFHGPYKHLLNFFYSSQTETEATQLYRLFDYIHVPSHYPDAHTVFNAARTTVDLDGDGNFEEVGGFEAPTKSELQSAIDASDDEELANVHPTALSTSTLNGTRYDTAGFYAPFNVLSKYREPGRINLNTIWDEQVFNALMNGRNYGGQWAAFVASRRGYGFSSEGDIFQIDNGYPAYVCNPFRMTERWNAHVLGGGVPNGAFGGVNVSVLRPFPPQNPATADPSKPTQLFGSLSNTFLHRHNQRNSHFAYESLQRLGNLVTTQSNVYAVWMTIGYFEVTPVAIDDGHPDGYTLGTELGRDTGQIERHRAYYMIDRSIPVAFENGKDHNAEKTILLRRFIE